MAAKAPMMPRQELKPNASALSLLIRAIASLSVTILFSVFLENALSSSGIFALLKKTIPGSVPFSLMAEFSSHKAIADSFISSSNLSSKLNLRHRAPLPLVFQGTLGLSLMRPG